MPAAPLEDGFDEGCEQTLHYSLSDLRRIKSGSHASFDSSSMTPLAARIITGSSAFAARVRSNTIRILGSRESEISIFILNSMLNKIYD
jgi:hypothetical protein